MSTLLEQRRIEAKFAKTVYTELKTAMGDADAIALLGRVAKQQASEAGASFAENSPDQSLMSFASVIPKWQEGGALDITFNEQSETSLSFDVTRCRYAEMYNDIGAPELGAALSCNRDGALCTGFNPSIKMDRQKTIMQGDPYCKFRFSIDE